MFQSGGSGAVVPPVACFQLEHFVRLSNCQLTGPEVHWTMCVYACARSTLCDCMVLYVYGVCINMGESMYV